ncbi:hypothetical protein, partial [Acinetobacter pragensis]|uniref:hypothetical protein n=1 Tax=Acinetobacter pragensis TaxID=1806892 RepID=UPI0039F0D691
GYPCESKSSPAHYSKHPLITQGVFFYVQEKGGKGDLDKCGLQNIKCSTKCNVMKLNQSYELNSLEFLGFSL